MPYWQRPLAAYEPGEEEAPDTMLIARMIAADTWPLPFHPTRSVHHDYMRGVDIPCRYADWTTSEGERPRIYRRTLVAAAAKRWDVGA